MTPAHTDAMNLSCAGGVVGSRVAKGDRYALANSAGRNRCRLGRSDRFAERFRCKGFSDRYYNLPVCLI
jgi:hypothetical protein